MNRRFAHLLTFAIALAGCQGPTLTESSQALEDCTPGGNFPGAQMPPVLFYEPGQQLPFAELGKEGWVVFQRMDGNWVAALGNSDEAQVKFAVQVKPAYLGNLLDALSLSGQIDVVRPPPGPRPIIEASFVLEYRMRSAMLFDLADRASRQKY